MKISYNWLKQLAGVGWSVEEVAHRFTMCGLPCEEYVATDRYMNKVVVGEVLEVTAIDGASNIRRTLIDVGGEKLQIVCGAPNIAEGQKVPVALIGAKVAGDLKIKKAKIRGVESHGMVCSEAELGLSNEHDGIIVLDSSAKVGADLAGHLDYHDYMLDLEITPNRGDALSAIGAARDLAALAGTKIKRPTFELTESKDKTSDHISVRIEDAKACPRFTARIIRNVRIGESPQWLKNRLLSAGIRPISNIVDITNYVMLETGNPIHAFDLDRFDSGEIIIRRATKDEPFSTLDGKKHKLTPDVLMVTNGKIPIAAAGIMGGLDSEVSNDTKNILLEVACFNPSVIRKGKRVISTESEASYRFERGVDPNNLPNVSDRAAFLLGELCGGEILAGMVDCYPEVIKPRTISLRPERCDAILGVKIEPRRMVEILKGLEFTVESEGPPIEVTVPTFRPDIEKEIDLIEEVARIEGYDSIPNSDRNVGSLYTPLHQRDLIFDDIRHCLTSVGFDEMLGHGLAHSRLASLVSTGVEQLKILNPVSVDLDIMRNSLTLSALPVISHNISHRQVDLRLFEIGKAYFPPGSNGEWLEDDRLVLVVTGNTEIGWREKPRALDFFDIKGALASLSSRFGWLQFSFPEVKDSRLDPGCSFGLSVGHQEVGVIGLVNNSLLKEFEIKQPVWLAEMSLVSLIEAGKSLASFTPLPMYPAAPRDLAVVVAEEVRVAELIAEVRKAATELAEAVTIFDLYQGKQIPEGKKSVGIAITYRSSQRSLSGDEVDKIQSAVIKRLNETFDAEVRER